MSASWCHLLFYHAATCFSTCIIKNGLLQCSAVWTSVYDTRSVAASSQCCNPSRRWSWFSRPRNRTNEEAPVANQIPLSILSCLMMHAAVTGQCPQYIHHVVHPLSTLHGRNRLRATVSEQFDIPRTRTVFGERAFSVAGPREWNTLPQDITDITNKEDLNELLRHYF